MRPGPSSYPPPDPTSDGPPEAHRRQGPDSANGDDQARATSAGQAHSPSQLLLAGGLFLATLATTTTFGAGFCLSTRTDVVTDLVPAIEWIFLGQLQQFLALTGYIFRTVWSDGQLLRLGLAFSLPTLAILLSHELGHYIACRRHHLSSTYPYFIPAPLLIGTFGAFIRIRAPIRTRRELFDVGAAGPIAGFLVLLPFLLYGIANSEPVSIVEVDWDLPGSLLLLKPGTSILMAATTYLFHGPLPANSVLNLHPFALAAWVGTFVTSLNLIPVGQLDGGHIFYAAFGRRLRSLSWWLLGLLAVMGFLWPGWWLWSIVLLIMRPRHPPVLDGRLGLDRRRRTLATISLVIFLLTFMPVPLELLPILS